MASRRWLVGLTGVLVLCGACAADDAGTHSSNATRAFAPTAPLLPLHTLPPTLRDSVQAVLEKPTLSATSKPETFNANPATYRWLLQHPDLDIQLWRRLGAKAADVVAHDGLYTWRDNQGSEMFWRMAYCADGTHAWYAEGKMKPALLLPASPFRAVVVMQYTHGRDLHNKPAIRHQVHFFLRCDSRAMALAARILGASAPHMAEQYLGQLQMFYGGLAWYLYKDDARARRLFREAGLTAPETVIP